MAVEQNGDTKSYQNASGQQREALGVVVLGQEGGSGGPSQVEVTNFPETQPVSGPLTDAELRATAVPVSGPLTNAQLTAVLGTAAATAVTTDPAAAGQTVVALLRGILQEMQTQTGVLNQIQTNTAGGAAG